MRFSIHSQILLDPRLARTAWVIDCNKQYRVFSLWQAWLWHLNIFYWANTIERKEWTQFNFNGTLTTISNSIDPLRRQLNLKDFGTFFLISSLKYWFFPHYLLSDILQRLFALLRSWLVLILRSRVASAVICKQVMLGLAPCSAFVYLSAWMPLQSSAVYKFFPASVKLAKIASQPQNIPSVAC